MGRFAQSLDPLGESKRGVGFEAEGLGGGGKAHPDDLQGQMGVQWMGLRAGPAVEQVPDSQPEVLGDQKPQPGQGAGDLLSQQLSNHPLATQGGQANGAVAFTGVVSGDE